MRLLIALHFIIFVTACSTSKKIMYNFESKNITDSVTAILKKSEHVLGKSYQDLKWFALIREQEGNYDLIINERFGEKESPLNKIIKSTNRFVRISNIQIPIVFESDILGMEFKKNNIGYINCGGYYFRIIKENGQYLVKETSVLF